MKEIIMMTPGTLRVSPRVLAFSVAGQFHHRSEAVVDAFAEIKDNLRWLLPIPPEYDLVFFPTTGRGGLEALISAIVKSHPALIIANGRWSNFMAATALAYNPNPNVLRLPHTEPIDLQRVEEALKLHKPMVVCFTSHETERGLLNPSAALIRLCKRYRCFVMVDAMSSVIIEPTDFAALGADAFCFNACKGLRSLRDVAIVAVKRSFAETLVPTGFYFNFVVEHKRQLTDIPFNPFPVGPILALREATRELAEEGIAVRRAAVVSTMRMIHQWVKIRQEQRGSNGVSFITDPAYLGNYTIPIRLPVPLTYKQFRAALLQRGFDVYYSFEGEHGNTFELSTVGWLSEEDVRKFIRAADEALSDLCKGAV